MTTINLDDELINQVITKSHYKNVQEAVSKILSYYLKQPNIIDLLTMPEAAEIEFNPPKLNITLKQQSINSSLTEEEKKQKYEAIMEISKRCASLPELDNKSSDEILGYDKSPMGLWGDE